MGGAPAFPAHDGLQIVPVLDDPHQFLRLHEVERDGAGDGLALGYGALGDVPEDGGLDQTGLGAVPIQVLLRQAAAAGVLRQGIFLVQGDQPVLQG